MSLSLCAALCILLCCPPLSTSPSLSISPSLTLPTSCLDHSIPLFLLPPSSISLSLSGECLCNSYSYLLVGARIRASLLMCSCSPRESGDRENILKKLKLHAGKRGGGKAGRWMGAGKKHLKLESHAKQRTGLMERNRLKLTKNIYFNYSLQVELILSWVLWGSWLCSESLPGFSDRKQAF